MVGSDLCTAASFSVMIKVDRYYCEVACHGQGRVQGAGEIVQLRAEGVDVVGEGADVVGEGAGNTCKEGRLIMDAHPSALHCLLYPN